MISKHPPREPYRGPCEQPIRRETTIPNERPIPVRTPVPATVPEPIKVPEPVEQLWKKLLGLI